MKKSEIVNHFKTESDPRRTIYNTINRMELGGTINEKIKLIVQPPDQLLERIS